MSTTTPVSGVSGGSARLADQVHRRFVRRWPSRPSPLSRSVPLADPLARQVSHVWFSRPSGAHSSDCEDVCLMRPFAPRGSQTGSPQVAIQAHTNTGLAGDPACSPSLTCEAVPIHGSREPPRIRQAGHGTAVQAEGWPRRDGRTDPTGDAPRVRRFRNRTGPRRGHRRCRRRLDDLPLELPPLRSARTPPVRGDVRSWTGCVQAR